MRHGTLLLLLSVLIVLPGFPAGQDPALPSMPSGLQVRADNRYFDIQPRIVPADSRSTVEIIPKFDHVRFNPECSYELTYSPVEQIARKSGWKPRTREPVAPENGRLLISRLFEGEQEHTLVIEEIRPDKRRRVFCIAHIYSLEPDLFRLRPYKGEFHLHSHNSDGVESPAYVAGAGRRAGLDFMALTDHRKYGPSLQAADFFKDIPVDLRIFPGEEVHPPDNPVHIISFGAKAGITEFYQDPESEKTYREEVRKLRSAAGNLPAGVDPYLYASCVWAGRKIRELGGLSMFAHAYWYTDNRFGAPGPLRDLLLQERVFDVLELVSGFDAPGLSEMDTNGLQVARYYEEWGKGNRLAIAGISDAHGVEKSSPFGRNYTICFATSPEFPAIKASIQEYRSVAVEAINGMRPRPWGPFRLVKFSHFLLREVLPQHDELCFEEGRLMIQHAAGDSSAAEKLGRLRGQVVALYNRYWGK